MSYSHTFLASSHLSNLDSKSNVCLSVSFIRLALGHQEHNGGCMANRCDFFSASHNYNYINYIHIIYIYKYYIFISYVMCGIVWDCISPNSTGKST